MPVDYCEQSLGLAIKGCEKFTIFKYHFQQRRPSDTRGSEERAVQRSGTSSDHKQFRRHRNKY